MGPPHRDGEGENQVVVFARTSVEGQMTGRGVFNTEILQLADQCLRFCELALDLEPPLVQQGLQARNQRQFRHAADRAVPRLCRPGSDQDAQRRDSGMGEHLENGLPNAGNVDHQLGSSRQFAKQPPDMGDNPGVRGPERHALEMTYLKDRRRRDHEMNLSKSSTRASSIISDEKAELSASMNSPSNSCANSNGPSFWRIFSRNSAPIRGHSRPTILIRSTSTPCCQFS